MAGVPCCLVSSKTWAYPSALPPPLPSLQPAVRATMTRRHLSLRLLRCSSDSVSCSAVEASPSCRVFAKGLSCSTSEGYLANVFSSFGEVKRVKILLNKSSKQSLGFAYIWFAREEEAQLAVNEMDGKFFDGRFITVMMASSQTRTKQTRVVPYKF